MILLFLIQTLHTLYFIPLRLFWKCSCYLSLHSVMIDLDWQVVGCNPKNKNVCLTGQTEWCYSTPDTLSINCIVCCFFFYATAKIIFPESVSRKLGLSKRITTVWLLLSASYPRWHTRSPLGRPYLHLSCNYLETLNFSFWFPYFVNVRLYLTNKDMQNEVFSCFMQTSSITWLQMLAAHLPVGMKTW